MDEGRGIHGTITDNPLALALLELGNRLRYGKSEGERQQDVEALRTPGIRDAAYVNVPSMTRDEEGKLVPSSAETFDPAAAERYTSAYEFGKRFSIPLAAQPAMHSAIGGSRELMAKAPWLARMFGVGEERPELRKAEELGMQRGAVASGSPVEGPLLEALANIFLGQ